MQHRGSPAAFMRLECVAQRWWDTTRRGCGGVAPRRTANQEGSHVCCRMARSRLAGMALVGCVVLALTGAAEASAETATFNYTGGEQEFKVPSDVRACKSKLSERGRHGTGRGAWRQGSGRWRRTVGQTRRSALCRGRRSAFQRWRRHVRRGRQRRRGVRRQDGLDWRRTEPRQRSIAGASAAGRGRRRWRRSKLERFWRDVRRRSRRSRRRERHRRH